MTVSSQSDIVKKEKSAVDSPYAFYVLGILLIFNILNYLDRSILTILAEDIKADLGITDSQIGFLSGTAFAVFYATFGMALGRLADTWNRKKLVAIGLVMWSGMTALSGLARSFIPMAFCRFGVAVGESSAAPAAYSLIYDYFSARYRTFAIAIYASAVSIGGGLGLFFGGKILEYWKLTWPDQGLAPFGLAGWQAAFIIVGLPGILMAIWVATIREPVRGLADGVESPKHAAPFQETLLVLLSMIPVVNWKSFLNHGRKGQHALKQNIFFSIILIFVIWGLIALSGNPAQWLALGIGLYAAFSWAQGLAIRDYVVFGMIFKCRTLLSVLSGQCIFGILVAGVPFWAVPYFQRQYELTASEVGAVLGAGGPVVGIVGLLLGGRLADILKNKSGRGKLFVWLGGSAAAVTSAFSFVLVSDVGLAYFSLFSLYFFCSIAGSPCLATLNDLVLPRARATTTGFTFMALSLASVILGPFSIGFVSDSIAASGFNGGESLRQAMLWAAAISLMGLFPAVYALFHVEQDESHIIERARALGEEI